MADFTPQQISEILAEFFDVVGTRQYIGARYVPIFGRRNETSIEWDNSDAYEPLTVVVYQGNSYTSRTYVPAGVEITDTYFWANTGNYNAQIEQYRRDTQEVATFTKINNVLAFNTVSELKDCDYLRVGARCKTLGYFAAGDGGGAEYIIVESATANDMDVIECGNLFAILSTNKNNPACYGADSTGVRDSYVQIQECFDANAGSTVKFSKGIYKVSDTLITKHAAHMRLNIDFGGSTILFTKTDGACLNIGGNTDDGTTQSGNVLKTFIQNCTIICTNENTTGIIINDYYKNVSLSKLNIRNALVGVMCGTRSGYPGDIQIDDCFVSTNRDANENSKGIVFYSSDNKICNSRIYGFFYAFESHTSGNFIINVHGFGVYNPISTSIHANTAFLYSVSGGTDYIRDSVCDTFGNFIKFAEVSGANVNIINCVQTSAYGTFRQSCINASDAESLKGIIKNNHITFAGNYTHYGVIFPNNENIVSLCKAQLKISGNRIFVKSGAAFPLGDILTAQDNSVFYDFSRENITDNESWIYMGTIPMPFVVGYDVVNVYIPTAQNTGYEIEFKIASTRQNVTITRSDNLTDRYEVGANSRNVGYIRYIDLYVKILQGSYRLPFGISNKVSYLTGYSEIQNAAITTETQPTFIDR